MSKCLVVHVRVTKEGEKRERTVHFITFCDSSMLVHTFSGKVTHSLSCTFLHCASVTVLQTFLWWVEHSLLGIFLPWGFCTVLHSYNHSYLKLLCLISYIKLCL